MRTIKLTLAYDGTAYAGWQIQPDQPTVQAALEATIKKVTGSETRAVASGRTDAGVHALGQVVAFQTESQLPVEVLQRALNAELPGDIAVLDAAEVAEGFHPIRDALRKRYRYVIHDGPVRDIFQRFYCWHYHHGRLDAEAMHRAARLLVGKHDFSTFESAGAERATSIRTICDIFVRRTGQGGARPTLLDKPAVAPGRTGQGGGTPNTLDGLGRPSYKGNNPTGAGGGDWIVLEVEADGFLYNMVRAIVGTLVEVGRGARPESWVGEVLAATDRSAAGPTAPPQGLFLLKVDYSV